MSKATITSKGQITIPLSIRRALGLNERDRLEFEVEGDVLTARPIRNSMLNLYGVAVSKKKAETKEQARETARRFVSQRWAKKGRA